MGDVLTGDGIERVLDEQSLSAPDGGEGGSVLQALGSKGSSREARARRRKAKKDSYAEYLKSPQWKKIRARVLKRDKHKCRACHERATVVHHIRYPKNLGEEKLEWLYSLCVPCHDAIHRAARTMTLRRATELILAAGKNPKITHLADDWQLSKSATKTRQLKRGKGRKRKRVKPAHIAADRKKSMMLSKNNDELHEFFKANRERRERRRSWTN